MEKNNISNLTQSLFVFLSFDVKDKILNLLWHILKKYFYRQELVINRHHKGLSRIVLVLHLGFEKASFFLSYRSSCLSHLQISLVSKAIWWPKNAMHISELAVLQRDFVSFKPLTGNCIIAAPASQHAIPQEFQASKTLLWGLASRQTLFFSFKTSRD